jgi:hypothetical protein
MNRFVKKRANKDKKDVGGHSFFYAHFKPLEKGQGVFTYFYKIFRKVVPFLKCVLYNTKRR